MQISTVKQRARAVLLAATITTITTTTTITTSLALIAPASHAQDALHPAQMSKADIAGAIFQRPDTLVTGEGVNKVEDVTSMMSSDGRFGSGMYTAGPSRAVIDEPYGVDEFMYFLEGGVTLTSSDGTVTEIEAGEAVTISKEWTGIWETQGYKKIWVIYSHDGSGFQ